MRALLGLGRSKLQIFGNIQRAFCSGIVAQGNCVPGTLLPFCDNAHQLFISLSLVGPQFTPKPASDLDKGEEFKGKKNPEKTPEMPARTP